MNRVQRGDVDPWLGEELVEEPAGVGFPVRGGFAGVAESFGAEESDGLEEPVAAVVLVEHDEGLVDERGEHGGRRRGRIERPTDRLHGPQLEAAGEHGEASQELALGVSEEVVAPLERRPKAWRVCCGRDVVRVGGRTARRLGAGDLRRRLCGTWRPRVDRERDPVESATQLYGLVVVGLAAEPVVEQLDGGGGGIERRDRPDPLPSDMHRLATGHEHPACRALVEDRFDCLGHGIEQVFGVVDDQQRRSVAEMSDQRLSRCDTVRDRDPQRRDGCRNDLGRVGHRRQVNECGGVELGGGQTSGFDGEAGLADPADPSQGHQPGRTEQRRDLAKVPFTPKDVIARRRQDPRT